MICFQFIFRTTCCIFVFDAREFYSKRNKKTCCCFRGWHAPVKHDNRFDHQWLMMAKDNKVFHHHSHHHQHFSWIFKIVKVILQYVNYWKKLCKKNKIIITDTHIFTVINMRWWFIHSYEKANFGNNKNNMCLWLMVVNINC